MQSILTGEAELREANWPCEEKKSKSNQSQRM